MPSDSESLRMQSQICHTNIASSCEWLYSITKHMMERGSGEQFKIEDKTMGIYAIKRHRENLRYGNMPMSGSLRDTIKITAWLKSGCVPWWTPIKFKHPSRCKVVIGIISYPDQGRSALASQAVSNP